MCSFFFDSFTHIPIVYCELGPSLPIGLMADGNRRQYTTGSAAHLSCSNSHLLIGNSTLLCMSNGKWNSPLPYCISKDIIHIIKYT